MHKLQLYTFIARLFVMRQDIWHGWHIKHVAIDCTYVRSISVKPLAFNRLFITEYFKIDVIHRFFHRESSFRDNLFLTKTLKVLLESSTFFRNMQIANKLQFIKYKIRHNLRDDRTSKCLLRNVDRCVHQSFSRFELERHIT